MDKEQIIELLRQDMAGEHQAIIQYLFHAYGMAEGEIPCEVETISREEMRHFDWLGEAILELGGDPTMERLPVDFSPGTPKEQLLKDRDLEQVAIDLYRKHIDMIDDNKIRRLLARILHDELVHKKDFLALAEEAEAEGVGPAAPPDVQAPNRLAMVLNEGVRHEYTVILQYLYHYFVAEDKEVSESLHDRAVNEMQHMGWLSEALGERGGTPDMTHTDLVLSRDMEKNLEADIAVEQEVTGAYSSQIPELEDEELEELFVRIRDHEIYHDAVFKDLLQEIREGEPAEVEEPEPQVQELIEKVVEEEDSEKEAPPPSIPSVGSLKGERS